MNVENPFELNNWLNTDDPVANHGASGTGEDLQAGRLNGAYVNDATIVQTIAAENAALVSRNGEGDARAVGLHGEADTQHGGIGTSGFCNTGVGVYGISGSGIGISGRTMRDSRVGASDDRPVPALPLEELLNSTGVFGHASHGTGVRGHGGQFSFLKTEALSSEVDLRRRDVGAVFSTGSLKEQAMENLGNPLFEFSTEAAPQFQLIPSYLNRVNADTPSGSILPKEGKTGDFYLVVDSRKGLHMYVCVGFGQHVDKMGQKTGSTLPIWRRLKWDDNGSGFGGDPVPMGV